MLKLRSATWRHPATARLWTTSMTAHVFPVIGSKSVSSITAADVLGVLAPIWTTTPEAARRARHQVGLVLKWVMAEGHRTDNPAGAAISAALPRNSSEPKTPLSSTPACRSRRRHPQGANIRRGQVHQGVDGDCRPDGVSIW